MAKDSRGVLRGRCTTCECVQYISQPEYGAFKCSQCGHPPGKHVNLTASHPQPAPPSSYAGVVSHHVTQTPHQHSSPGPTTLNASAYHGGHSHSGHAPYDASSYHNQPPPNLHLPDCPALDCPKKVYYDRELGPFDYCSPECRDRHLLPTERHKLEEDIKSFSRKIADLPSLDTVQSRNQSSKGPSQLKCVVADHKQPKEDIGLVVGKDSVEEGLLVTGVKIGSLAYKSVKEGRLKFLDVITELSGMPCRLESEFQKSVCSKTLVELTLKRPYSVPSVKKLLSEVERKYPSDTHILVLQNPKQTSKGYGFGCVPYFIQKHGVMLALAETSQCSAYQSGATSDDVIMMYAIMDKNKIGDLKLPYSKTRADQADQEVKGFKSDIEKAAQNGSSLILVLKRLERLKMTV